MSEEEIIKTVDNFLDGYRQYNVETGETYIPYKYGEGQKFCYVEDFEAIQGLLDLYNKEKLNSFNLSEQLNKEKEKNKELEKDKKYKDRIIKGLGLNTIPRTINSLNEMIDKYYINKDKIRDLIVERQFELQQEFKEFKDDIRLNTLQEIYYLE